MIANFVHTRLVNDTSKKVSVYSIPILVSKVLPMTTAIADSDTILIAIF